MNKRNNNKNIEIGNENAPHENRVMNKCNKTSKKKKQWETHKLIETKTQTQNGKKNKETKPSSCSGNKTQKSKAQKIVQKTAEEETPKNSQFIWVSKKLQNSHLKS